MTRSAADAATVTEPDRVTEAIRAIAASPGLLLVVADFDGTLADFHPHPMGAFLAPGVRPTLRRLARHADAHPDRLAMVVLSGRAVPDLAARVRVGGVRYLGNHGNERGDLARGRPAESVQVRLIDGLEPFIPTTERIGDGIVAALSRPDGQPPDWLYVERKGPSISFHYRAAPDHRLARRRLDGAIAGARAAGRLDGYRRIDQRLIIEFQPALAGAKGAAMKRLVAESAPTAVLILGDDVPDAEAFDVAHGAVSDGRIDVALTIAVSHGRPLHVDLEAAADAVVKGTRGAAAALRILADAVALEPLGG